jgi:hypothetical protein
MQQQTILDMYHNYMVRYISMEKMVNNSKLHLEESFGFNHHYIKLLPQQLSTKLTAMHVCKHTYITGHIVTMVQFQPRNALTRKQIIIYTLTLYLLQIFYSVNVPIFSENKPQLEQGA